MYTYSFEKLEVWQMARKLVKLIYKITSILPDEEKFGLANQIRRASISVVSNIAEGSSRKSYKDQAHFTQIAYSSLMEVLCQIILCGDLGYINENKIEESRQEIESLSYKLNAYYNSQTNKPINK